jgi:hypothetical protein
MLSRRVNRIHGLACWILIVLGVAHALGTVADAFAPTFFAPHDSHVLAQMRITPTALSVWFGAPRMTVWTLYLGCSISQGIGLAFMGAVQLLLQRSNPHSLAFARIVPLAAFMSLVWAAIAAACWFWFPFVGFVLAAAGFAYTWRGLRRAPPTPVLPAADLRLLWVGSLAMGVAGAIHVLVTIPDIFAGGAFSPASPDLRHGMEQANVMLPSVFGASASIWGAYLGFNLAHGLAVAVFALTAWLLAHELSGVVARDRALLALFAVTSAVWFVVAIVFWFYAPIVATAAAAICHCWLLARPAQSGIQLPEKEVDETILHGAFVAAIDGSKR